MIERERCDCLYVMFDTIWVPVLEHPRFAEADLSAVRTIYLVGPPERMRGFQQRMPWLKVATAFGMTEVCAHLTLAGPDADEETRLTTAGPVRRSSRRGSSTPRRGGAAGGEVGEMLLGGHASSRATTSGPRRPRRRWSDGWFHSGDLGLLDEDGRITYQGRLKDMLKVGGENVSPSRWRLPGAARAVAIVQVVAAPDARSRRSRPPSSSWRRGRADGGGADRLLPRQDREFKVPRYVRFVDEWPMSGTKIQKSRFASSSWPRIQALDERGAAVDDELGAGHVAGEIAREEQDGERHLARVGTTAERDVGTAATRGARHTRRLHAAGQRGVDADPGRCERFRQRRVALTTPALLAP